MASEDDDSGDQADTSHGPQECMPCRGTGKVISNLGGKASKITCPWCEGDGTRKPEVDAQTRWLGGEGAGAEAPEGVGAASEGQRFE
jgi:DnaJ-class molecular chaperone